jgi:hypothetical protein
LDEWSLAEWLLRSLTQQTGVSPGGDLLTRLDNTPPLVLRNLNALDDDIVRLAAGTPLDVAPVLADLLDDACGDDDRLDLEKAFELLRAEADSEEPDDSEDDGDADDDEIAPLYDIAHEALGLPTDCAACRAAVHQDDDDHEHEHEHEHDADDEDEHAHSHQQALLDVVFTEHADDLNAWEPQIAWRIARQAGGTFTSRSGLMLLHEAFTHGPGTVDPAQKEIAHQLQHLGLAKCEDSAQVQALRLAIAALRVAESPAAGYATAEEAAHQDAAALAYIPASVAVGLVGQRIALALDTAPAPVPTRRLPKGKRRR